MIGLWKRKPTLEALRAAQEARREALKNERTKTDEMGKAVSGLLDELLVRGLNNGR